MSISAVLLVGWRREVVVGNGQQRGVNVVDGSRGLDGGVSEQAADREQLIETVKSLCVCCCGYLNQPYATCDRDCLSVKYQPR